MLSPQTRSVKQLHLDAGVDISVIPLHGPLQDLLPPREVGLPVRTLVIDMDTVVNYEWDRAHGWRVYKRPGLNEFLDYLSSAGAAAMLIAALLTHCLRECTEL
eukprot:SAG31_NODE_15170_length_767_cov_0.922156_2_plen_103_part_00